MRVEETEWPSALRHVCSSIIMHSFGSPYYR